MGTKVCRAPAQALEQVREAAQRDQAHVLGEHGEHGAHEERRHVLGGPALRLEGLRELGQAVRDVARDARRLPRGVERERVEPDGLEALAHVLAAQVFELDAVRARVGERRVRGPRAAELGVQLDAAAHVGDQQEGRPPLVGGQRTRVAVGLVLGPQHGLVPAARVERLARLLGLAHERRAAVQVDEAAARGAVRVAHDHAALEDVGVVARVVARRVRHREAQQHAQLRQEQLVVGALRAPSLLPTTDERLDGCGSVLHARRIPRGMQGRARLTLPATCGNSSGGAGDGAHEALGHLQVPPLLATRPGARPLRPRPPPGARGLSCRAGSAGRSTGPSLRGPRQGSSAPGHRAFGLDSPPTGKSAVLDRTATDFRSCPGLRCCPGLAHPGAQRRLE
jgi:hypothetical protein